MKIIKVIHGYPMRYNAGSEVYSQTICQGLSRRGHDVHVFTREEDPFRNDGDIRHERDVNEPGVRLRLVNNPRHKDRYRVDVIDKRFGDMLDEIRPDIVHVGHLNHLSTSLVFEAKSRKIPIIFTLHDFWLMCPRGQFMQMHTDEEDLWAVCEKQENRTCAIRCFSRYFSGDPQEEKQDRYFWENWVKRRMDHIKDVANQVDLFISPSQYLKKRFTSCFSHLEEKTIYMDYGFDRSRLQSRSRNGHEPFTFGYIGTHSPSKGVNQLIEAFSKVNGQCQLRIWGRDRGEITQALKKIADRATHGTSKKVEWMHEYKNHNIVPDVFDHVDAIVVPSIWTENSPLVIHEAQQASIPVITANVGGMAEYVHHHVNGLLFAHRSPDSMSVQMQYLLDAPPLAVELGMRGYLYSEDGQIPDLDEHLEKLETIYKEFV